MCLVEALVNTPCPRSNFRVSTAVQVHGAFEGAFVKVSESLAARTRPAAHPTPSCETSWGPAHCTLEGMLEVWRAGAWSAAFFAAAG